MSLLGFRGSRLFNTFAKLCRRHSPAAFYAVKRRAQSYGKTGIFGENRVGFVKSQCFRKAAAKSLAEVQRATQKHNGPADSSALCKTGNCLVYHSLIYTCRYVLFARALIEQRLYIGFRKNAAS